jgi:hypothetical protein
LSVFYNIHPADRHAPIGFHYLKVVMLMMLFTTARPDDRSDGVQSFEKQRHYIIGYVIMPSHVHAVIAFSNTGKTINSIISNGKRFIAYDLITKLTEQHQSLILHELSSSLNNTEKKEGKLHNVFETSFDWKECRTEKFIQQKPDCIHYNPCKAKLVELPEQYLHSSAKFYVIGEHGIYPVTSFMELRDIDLTRSRI